MDLATIVGLILAFAAILVGQALEGGHVGSLLQHTAAIIVIGGTFGACLVQFPLSVAIESFKSIQKAFFEPKISNKKIVEEIIGFANKARKEGIISLQSETENASDPFLKKALNMAVDGIGPKVLRESMEMELTALEEEREHAVKFWEAAGGYSPTIGIIGAVLGLIHVMENLSDPSKLGGGIAVAFVATVYGVSLANIIFLPIAGKLKIKNRGEILSKEIMLIGVISVLEGEHPRLIEEKLMAFVREKETKRPAAGEPSSQKRAA